MLKVVVIGSGNVAWHLAKVFRDSGQVKLVQAFARHPEKLAGLLPASAITGNMEELAEADVYIISVTDDAIADVSSLLPFEGRLVVHTSGSVAMQEIHSKNRRGVFYPLQTFSKSKEVDFSEIPICLESESKEDYGMLEQLAKSVSGHVYSIDSEQRQALHVAAVFVSNFVNHMYAIGHDICKGHNIPFDLLKPLIKETADKVQELLPHDAQTGPAIRNDVGTMQKHLDFLQEETQKKIYKLLSQSIQNSNGKKL